MFKSLYNKVPGLAASNFIKKDVSVNIAKVLRAFFYRTPPVTAPVTFFLALSPLRGQL